MAKIRILKTVDVHVKFKLYWKSVTDIVLVIKRQKVAWQCLDKSENIAPHKSDILLTIFTLHSDKPWHWVGIWSDINTR